MPRPSFYQITALGALGAVFFLGWPGVLALGLVLWSPFIPGLFEIFKYKGPDVKALNLMQEDIQDLKTSISSLALGPNRHR